MRTTYEMLVISDDQRKVHYLGQTGKHQNGRIMRHTLPSEERIKWVSRQHQMLIFHRLMQKGGARYGCPCQYSGQSSHTIVTESGKLYCYCGGCH